MLEPHPSADRFVVLARVAPFPSPYLLFLFVSRSLGVVVRSLPHLLPGLVTAFRPATRVYTPPGRRQPPGRSVSRSNGVVAQCLSLLCAWCPYRFAISGSRSPCPVLGPAPAPVFPSFLVPVPYPAAIPLLAACYPLALALVTLFLLRTVLGAAPFFSPSYPGIAVLVFFPVMWHPSFLVPSLHPLFTPHLSASNPVWRGPEGPFLAPCTSCSYP